VHEYRVTKYNPAFRDQSGAYTKVEWTFFKQIGQTFSGVLLTSDEYERVEEAYILAALSFLLESGLLSMRVEGLEDSRTRPLDFQNDSVLPLDRIGEIIRQILRESIGRKRWLPPFRLGLLYVYRRAPSLPHRTSKGGRTRLIC